MEQDPEKKDDSPAEAEPQSPESAEPETSAPPAATEASAGPPRPFITPGRVLFAAMLAFILFTRLWNLGLKPVQHDESMFALYSWQPYDALKKALKDRRAAREQPADAVVKLQPVSLREVWKRTRAAYDYQPILHGPVLQWVTAFAFLIVGDSNYTMRLVPALCGLATLLILFLLRDYIGRRAAYLAIAALAFSPTATFFSRYIRPDSIMLLEYMLIIFTAWKYSRTLMARWLIALIVLFWLGSATHETYVIYYFFLFTFAFGNWLHGFVKGKTWAETPFCRELRHAFLRHWWAVIIGNAIGAFLSVMFMTSLFYGPYMIHWDGQWEAVLYWADQNKKHRIEGEYHFYLMHLLLYDLPYLIFFVVMIVRQMWADRPGPALWKKRWLFIAWLAASWLILVFPVGKAGWVEGKNGWVKDVPHVPFPLQKDATYKVWNYPLPRTEKIKNGAGEIVEEKGPKVAFDYDKHFHMKRGFHIWLFLQILLVVMITGWNHLNNGRVFHAWIDYWACGSFLAYGYAGEKVPWVTWHIVLPMAISCGLYADMVWRRRFDPLLAAAPAPEPKAPAESKPEQADAKKKKKKGRDASNGAKRAEPREPAIAGMALLPNLARGGIVAFAVVGLAWSFYVFMMICFIQPGSSIERHTYASSHTEFHNAVEFMIEEAEEKFDGENTPIAWSGDVKYPEPGWPSVWIFRNWPNKITAASDSLIRINVPFLSEPGKSGEAVYALIQKEMFDLRPLPAFVDRYDWSRVRFRHYWVPERHPLDWDNMKRVGLLLRSENSLSPENRVAQRICRAEWKKLWSAVVKREEGPNRDGVEGGWNDLGGADVYVGRLKEKFQPKK